MKTSDRIDRSVIILTGKEPNCDEIAKLMCEAIKQLIAQPHTTSEVRGAV